MCESNDPRLRHLSTLGAELLAKGVKCELITTGYVPRLELNTPQTGWFPDSAFEDNILAANEPDGTWRFWWPWVQPIAPVHDLAAAAEHIYDTIGVEDSDQEDRQPNRPPHAPSTGRTTHS